MNNILIAGAHRDTGKAEDAEVRLRIGNNAAVWFVIPGAKITMGPWLRHSSFLNQGGGDRTT